MFQTSRNCNRYFYLYVVKLGNMLNISKRNTRLNPIFNVFPLFMKNDYVGSCLQRAASRGVYFFHRRNSAFVFNAKKFCFNHFSYDLNRVIPFIFFTRCKRGASVFPGHMLYSLHVSPRDNLTNLYDMEDGCI